MSLVTLRVRWGSFKPSFWSVSAYREPWILRTLTARQDLAYFTGMAGNCAGARDQFAALVPARERISGAEHPETLSARR